ENASVARWKSIDCIFQLQSIKGAGQYIVLGSVILLGRLLFALVFIVKRNYLQALLAKLHQHNVDRHAMQPGGESRLASQRPYLTTQLEKSFLGALFSFRRVCGHAQTQGVDASLMKVIENFKGGSIALL